MAIPNVAAGELIESAWGNQVGDEIDSHTATLAAHDTAINSNRTRAITMHAAQFDHPAIEARVAQVTTDSSGNATVTFNTAFATVPQVVTVASADFGTTYVIIPYDSTTNGTQFVINASNAAGAPQASVVVRFLYIAVGTWV